MSKSTKIQWCDGTINPVMGCGGCELFPQPQFVLNAIDKKLQDCGTIGWRRGRAKKYTIELIDEAWEQLLTLIGTPGPGHTKDLTLTNIYHLRERFACRVAEDFGEKASKLVRLIINGQLKCYAAKLHLNKGYSIVNPLRKPNKGYAPTFEQVTTFSDRMKMAAQWSDLYGEDREGKPWMNGLPRLIFVSDMGDALSRTQDFNFLQEELAWVESEQGQRHIWLWLSKRPQLMAEFANRIGGLPANVCAMTTVTGRESLKRVDALRAVEAPFRGLSIEPLWNNVADRLDLTGIDWVIVGGESGARDAVQPFSIEWVLDLKALCEEQGVAMFVKQLGRRPTRGGVEFSLVDKHGGDRDEWDDDLRVREFPRCFYSYREAEAATIGTAAAM